MARKAVSVIVVCFDMAREIPRTIRSLSAAMQRGLDPGDYEVILVDNNSRARFDEAECRRWIPDLRVEYLTVPTVSPVAAINRGLELAEGALVGVMIDGARLASPGLLRNALDASRLYDRPVIGSLGFHLGPDVQMRSVPAGYCQGVEDALLAASGWEEDGYRLFGISVFAGSSDQGWFAVPAETNALFLKREHWARLGGFDPGFVTPGGGLTNLDMWVRACADAPDQVILLLGEGTFHQVHGGVATNAAESKWELFHQEYVALRGQPFRRPEVAPLFYGFLHPATAASLQASTPADLAARLLPRGAAAWKRRIRPADGWLGRLLGG